MITSLYDTLLAAAPKRVTRFDIADQIDEVLDSARINANDTIYIEKAAPESEWNLIFKGTIESILAFGDYSAEVKAWFAAQGIRY